MVKAPGMEMFTNDVEILKREILIPVTRTLNKVTAVPKFQNVFIIFLTKWTRTFLLKGNEVEVANKNYSIHRYAIVSNICQPQNVERP